MFPFGATSTTIFIFFILGKSNKSVWNLSDLSKLPSNEFAVLLDEIPTDNESIISDEDSEDEEILERNMEIEIITEMENGTSMVIDDTTENDMAADDSDWDSEDNLHLAKFLSPSVPTVQNIRCAKCSTRKEPHRTRWHCSSCNVGLCLQEKKNCFVEFHKK